jgi:glycosyltransferase involved in cell wall biosynthesis
MAFRVLGKIPADSVIFSTGETWGLPYGIAIKLTRRKRIRHHVTVHRVFSKRWRRYLRLLRPLLSVDSWFCVTQNQKKEIGRILGEDAVIEVVGQGVDTDFFNPDQAKTVNYSQPYVLSIGAEMRDYTLLFNAAREFDHPVIVKASSNWMKALRARIDTVPSNVRMIEQRLTYPELRDLYAGAAVVVVPLNDSLQAAGITTILEAMSMRKYVISTRSAGLPDVLVGHRLGTLVNANANELAAAIEDSLVAGRRQMEIINQANMLVQETASIETYVTKIATILSREADPGTWAHGTFKDNPC